jgi:hypothetical protein
VSPALHETRPRVAPRRHGVFAPSIAILGVLAVMVASLSACAAPRPQTSRLTTQDFQDFSTELAQKLRDSDFLAGRTIDSPVIRIALSKVENLTTDLLSEGEKWYVVQRAFDSDTMDALRRDKAIRFVIAAEDAHKLEEAQASAGAPVMCTGFEVGAQPGRNPTHTATAMLRSVTRTAGVDRTDLYDLELRIVELASGQIVWSDHAAIKRVAVGKAYN